MDDATMQRKLDQIAKLSRELDKAVRERWSEGQLFAEADGGLYIMSYDPGITSSQDRQSHIEMSASKLHRFAVGAW